jgi:hypothetical protein
MRRSIWRMLRRLLFAASLLLIAGQAAASEKEGAPSKEVGQYVDLAPVGLPIVANGQLVNYVFVYVRINLNSGANVSKWREKEPYFRDVLVRQGHRAPFTLAGDYQHIDTARLTSVLYREASAIAGSGVIRSVVVSSQAPRWRARTPSAPR